MISTAPAQLARVTLVNVGARKARFEPVTLDFRGRDDLPAHTLVSLRNGGGKSTIINMLFSVLLPNATKFVGRNERGVKSSLADYVDSDDTSHIVIEWRPSESSKLLAPTIVTGVVMEWSSLRATGKLGDLTRWYYTFTSEDGQRLRFDTLPFFDRAGNRLRLRTFKQQLADKAAREPDADLQETEQQSKWTSMLAARGIDVGLYDIQADMNAREGGAGVLLKRFANSDELFEFVIDQTVPEERLDAVNESMAQASAQLREREALVLEQRFIGDILGPLTTAATASRDLADAAKELRREARRGGLLAVRLANKAAHDRTEAARLEEQASEDVEASGTVDGAADELADEVRRLDHAIAKLRLDTAVTKRDQAKEHHGTCSRAANAWDAVETTLELRRADRDLSERRDQQRQLETGAEPTRRDRDVAGAAYVAALDAMAERHDTTKSGKDSELEELDAKVLELRSRAAESRQQAASARRDAARLEQEKGRLAATRLRLAEEGVLLDDEAPGDAVARHEAVASEAKTEADARRGEITAFDARLEELGAQIEELEEEQARAAGAAARLEGLLAEPRRRYATLAQYPDVVERGVVDGDALAAEGPRLLGELRQLADDRDQRRSELDARRRLAVSERAALAAGEPLPTPDHVATVLQTLTDVGISAFTGWRYLLDVVGDPDGRADVIARNPAGVSGIVVLDGDDLAAAREALVDVAVPAALTVSTGASLLATSTVDSAAAFVVDVTAPAIDEQAAEERAAELDVLLEELDAADVEARERSERVRSAVDRLEELSREWPHVKLEETATKAATEAGTARRAQEALDAATADRDDVATDKAAVADELATAEARRREATDAARRAGDAAATEDGRFDTLASHAEQLLIDADGFDESAEDDERDAGLLQETRVVVVDAISAASTAATEARLRRDQVPRVEADADAVAAVLADEPDPDELERRWRRLADEYDQQVTDETLASEIGRLEARRTTLVRELPDDDGVRELAEALAVSDQAADHASRAAARHEARRLATEVHAALDRATIAYNDAVAALRDARAAASGELPAPVPADVETAARERGRTVAAEDEKRTEAKRLAERAERASRAAGRLKAEAREIELRATQIRSLLGDHDLTDVVGDEDQERQRPFDGDREGAEREADAALETIRARAGDVRDHTGTLHSAAAEARRIAASDVYASVPGVRQQVTALTDDTALGERGQQWVPQLEETAASLVSDLERIGRLEENVAEALRVEVETAFRHVRNCQKDSTLPDDASFGPWAGQPFLKIAFRAMPSEQLMGALVTAVRAAVAQGLQPTGRTLLKYAFMQVTSGRKAEVFCPDANLTDERYEIGDIKFSTGQSLTAAVLLYCAVARVRSGAHSNAKVGGPLILDNPVGEANHLTLIELMRAMADKLGIQLVYLSGILQRDVFESFGAVNRLANDRIDRSSGTAVLRVDGAGPGSVVAAQVFQDLPRNRPLTQGAAAS